jgi:hypothetical protein
LPDSGIEGVVLVGVFGVSAMLASQGNGLLSVQSRALGNPGGVEVDRPIALVGRSLIDQRGRQRDHLGHEVVTAWLVGRTNHTEFRHVAFEPIGLLKGERPPWHTFGLGPDEKVIVHIGHVATHIDFSARQT